MSASADAVTDLLTEHLQYTPANLLDEIIDVINILVQKSIDSLELGLLSAPPAALGFKRSSKKSAAKDNSATVETPEERARHEIENGVHQLETLLEATVDKNFDKMEIYAMRNIFSIPDDLRDWVRLSHYEGLNFTPTSDAPDLESVRLLRRKTQETQKLHQLLVREKSQNAAIIANLRALLSQPTNQYDEPTTAGEAPFAFLKDRGDLADGRTSNSLGMTSSFVLSQLPNFKTLLRDLRLRLHDLAQEPKGRDPNKVQPEEEKSFRRARLEYVETQTRKYLENVRGVELGPQGEVVDGDWQGEGRRPAKGEVQDLERIVGMVQRNQDDTMDEDD